MPDLPDVIHLPGPVEPAPEKAASRSGSAKRARPQVLYVRLTDSERAEMESHAQAAGLDIGTYARQAALSAPEARGTAEHVTSRPTRLPFRVSDAERVQIEESADRAGLTAGSYIRARALKKPVTLTTRRPPVDKTDLAHIRWLIGLAGSNANQIARQLNTDGEVPLIDVREAIDALQAAGQEISRILGRQPRPRVAR